MCLPTLQGGTSYSTGENPAAATASKNVGGEYPSEPNAIQDPIPNAIQDPI